MNSVNPVSSSYQGSSVTSQSASMDQDAFLQLLVTQLANQDPLNPMDNQEFAAQLAQYSSLEQLTKVNTNLESSYGLNESMAVAMQSSMASGLIGRNITAVEDRIVLDGDGAILRWEADGEVSRIHVDVISELGATVHSMDLDVAGLSEYEWDGRAGNLELPDGTYQISISATDELGNELAARPLHVGAVASVRYLMGEAWLMVDGLDIGLAQVSEVRLDGPDEEDGGTEGPAIDENGINW